MTDKNPKTRNSFRAVNRILNERQLRLKNKLERQGVCWREINIQLDQLV